MSKLKLENILETVRKNNPGADLELIKKAYIFAETAHSGQTRASGEPYIIHPLFAAKMLAEMKLDTATIAAALLHDVVDDTPFTNEDIKKEFGDEIAFLVEGVTKLGKIKYQGEERHAENLRKMFLAMAQDIRVVLIKLADRYHNMQTLSYLPERKRRRIALETLEIYSPLASRLGIGEIKGQLDDLAFPYVYPKEFQYLKSLIGNLYKKRTDYLEKIKPLLFELLGKEKIYPIAIHARAKHYYSLWKKLQRQNMEIDKIHDIVALRVLVKNISDCYAVLGAIHKHWRPIPGKVKDYIALPKPNGYRSLHTTVFCEDGVITEFQIRTPEMHEEAEYGITAHWAYEEEDKPEQGSLTHKKLRWVKQLSEWQHEIQGTDEFLDALKIDFFKERIFVYTPKGDVIELPEGATPLDFAFAIHSEIGEQASGARINDKFVGLNAPLHNGDVVDIIIQKGKKPSKTLIEAAKTTEARSHIRRALRAQGIDLLLKKEPIKVEMSLGTADRVGLLKDIAGILAKFGANIIQIESANLKNAAEIRILLTVKAKNDIPRIILRLKKTKGVFEVTSRFI